MEVAKVYVGTYRKYNNGNLDGAWIDLNKFKNYDAFIAECKRVHKDECDPEFMIQDHELPDGLGCGEWLSRKEFDDIKEACKPQYSIVDYSDKSFAVIGDTKEIKEQLKSLGGRFNFRLTCGAGWIFPNKARADVEKLLSDGVVSTEKSTKEIPLYTQMLNEFIEKFQPNDREYYIKYYFGAVKCNDGYILVSKPSIDNSFCFSDEGEPYDLYKWLTEEGKKEERLSKYFLDKNIKDVELPINKLKEERVYITDVYNHNSGQLGYDFHRYGTEPDFSKGLMPTEIKEQLIKVYEDRKVYFEKRLNSYLKRYGVSKIRTWTY